MAVAGEAFRAKGWLSGAPDDFREAVLERCHLKTFKAGAAVYCVGDPPAGLYGVLSGSVGFEIAPAEREPNLAFMGGPGAWFGFSGVVTRKSRLVTIVARELSELLFLPMAAVDEIIHEDPGRWRHLARFGIGEVKRATMLCDDLMRRDHVERVIAILLHFGDCRLPSERDLDTVEVTLTQDELAQAANVGRTVAGAVLRQLEAERLIELTYRHVCIVAPAAVRARLSAGKPLFSLA